MGSLAMFVAGVAVSFLFARARKVRKQRATRLSHSRVIWKRVIKGALIVLAAVCVLPALGIDLHGLWSMLAAVLSLVAIGFVAMWSILSHMLASLLLVAFRPFRIGDKVEIVGDDPIAGKVIDIGLVYTTLRTSEGGILRIPNNLFFQKVLKRFPRPVEVEPSARVMQFSEN